MSAFRHSGSDIAERERFEVAGRVVIDRPKAIYFDDGTVQQWLPKSKIKIHQNRDGTVSVFMPEWLAKEKKYV